jgi:type II secretory pathway pseudopilin PulG
VRRLSDQRGITLVELLIASFVSMVVLGATMSIVIVMARATKADDRQNEAQQTARETLDNMARTLRNMASPTSLLGTADVATAPRSIDRDLPNDLIFKDVDQVQPAGSLNKPNVRRVRYCLKSTTPANGVLYMQTQTWTTATDPAQPADTACPGAGWSATRIITNHVTNAVGNRAIFTYTGDAGVVTATDSSSRADISRVSANLFVDADTAQQPPETQLTTSVFLRNQNREPVASWLGSQILNTTTRTIQLNGSASTDPEGQGLTYQWFMDGGTTPIGTGVLVQFKVPAGQHSFVVKVFDPANLEGDSTPYIPFTS